jgi:peptidoglycan-associated lipoprotein
MGTCSKVKFYRTKFIAAAAGFVLHLMGSVVCAQGGSPRDPLADPNSPLAKRNIYFDLDSIAIRDEYRETIKAHATYLSTEGSRRLVIQGNAELRGSRETSLAIGGLRAEAVRAALLALGVSPGKMEAVSLGQEKPRALGRDQESSAENRRVDLVYP